MSTIPGVHEDISESGLKSKYPGVKLTREFVSGVLSSSTDIRPKVASVAQGSWDQGLIPVVSFKTDPSSTASGSYDARLDELGTYLAGKPETWIIWYHEPEDDMSGSTFAAAFNRVRSRLRAKHPTLKVGYSAMAYQWRPSSGTTPTTNPAPWRVTADFYGCDAYSGGSFSDEFILPEHPGFKRWYQELVVPVGGTDRWGLTERGWKASDSDSDRASDIDRERVWLLSLPATTGGVSYTEPHHYIYWNTTGTENNPDLVNGPLAEAEVKQLVADLAGEGSTPPPPPPPPTGNVPADFFDASIWKITLPVDANGGTSGGAREVLQPALDSFELDPYFVDVTDGVQYRAQVEGATTSGSEYPRSELREMTASGGQASWSPASGQHDLWIRTKVTHAPPNKPQVCVAQIHNGSDDVLQVLYDGTRNAITVRWRGTTQSVYLKSGYVLGTWFNVKVTAAGGRVKTYYNETPDADFTGAVKIHDFAATDTGCYFKAGVYAQSNETIDNPGAYGQAVFAPNFPKVRHI